MAKVAEGEKGIRNICKSRTIGGEAEMRKVGRDGILVYKVRRIRSPPARVPWELILGHDTYREIYRYLFAGRDLRFMTLKSSNGTNRS